MIVGDERANDGHSGDDQHQVDHDLLLGSHDRRAVARRNSSGLEPAGHRKPIGFMTAAPNAYGIPMCRRGQPHGFHILCWRSYDPRCRRIESGDRMFRSITLSAAAAVICSLLTAETAWAQSTDGAAQKEKPVWYGPFGGAFTA